MNTSSLKTFAQEARRKLRQQVGTRLDYWLESDSAEHRQFAPQIEVLQEALKTEGREALVERVAYTWFNRLAALRFMDANGYHRFGASVMTPATEHQTLPELLQQARAGALDGDLRQHLPAPETFDGILSGTIPVAHPEEEACRLLLFAVCHYYHRLLPFLFEPLGDATELLLPADLLSPHSILADFREGMPDADCSTVEVLGWLYQFYISERKDQVMARKSAVPTEDIPAVTQLFTPHWIVRYLVENSLGRLWLLNRPQSSLREKMPYYIEGAPAEPPAWQAAWGQRLMFIEHDCRTRMWLRPNAALQGNYDDTFWYALTIDGYAYGKARWGIETSDGTGYDKVQEIKRAGLENASFEDLRYALFAIQRGIKWAGGSGPTDELETQFHTVHAALCRAWDREWQQHAKELPDLSIVGVETTSSETDFLRITKPEEIRLCDPAVGSGHMLTYAFDLLTLIYEDEGYAPTEIPALILRHNLHGLEICPRAAQLAGLALVFKAREKSRRFFQPEHLVRPHIIELRDVRFAENELRDYIHALGLGDLFNQPVLRLLHQFEEAKNFGSLIQPCLDERAIADVRRAIEAKDLGGQLFLRETHLKVLRVLEQAEALTQRYHVVVANPPYMGAKVYNPKLKSFVQQYYPQAKPDLYCCFILRNLELVGDRGFVGMITIPNWMFLGTFEKLRSLLIANHNIDSLLQNGRGVWGADFGSCSFVVSKGTAKSSGVYRRLFESQSLVSDSDEIEQRFFDTNQYPVYQLSRQQLNRIPGTPIAYWVSEKFLRLFEVCQPLGKCVNARVGLMTSDNERFLRLWWEVCSSNACYSASTSLEAQESQRKWFPHNKGGAFRKWAGNKEYLVDWGNNGERIKALVLEKYPYLNGNPNFVVHDDGYYFSPFVSWSEITSAVTSFRVYPAGFTSNIKGMMAFPSSSCSTEQMLALCNSAFVAYVTKILNPSVSFGVGDFNSIPAALLDQATISPIVGELIGLARADWDNFETSWDFRDQPLLRPGLKGATLEASWRNWEAQSTAAIRRMQELETENNRLFIAAYGLDGELQPAVPEAQITLARAEARRDMAAFLSYAVGCMMGRFSLQAPGLILANAGDTLEDYAKKVASGQWPVASGKATVTPGLPTDHLPLTPDHWPLTPDHLPLTPDHLPLTPDHLPLTPDHLPLTPDHLPLTLTPDHLPLTTEFPPDEDGIIPILEGEWFEDDIVARTREFLRATFGEATLGENVKFIETSVGKDLRKYFASQFYKDHVQTYKKRPIYWMISSPEGSFQALIYLHRYTKDTLNVLLDKYVRAFLHKLEERHRQLTELSLDETKRPKERTDAQKEAAKIQKMLKELRDWDRSTVLPLAQQRIELDLDDGVKVNYQKFPGLLVKIPGLEKKEEE